MSWVVYWMSEDRQGFYDGGRYANREDAERAAEEFLDELLAQCADDEQSQAILAGSIIVEEVEE